MPVPRALALGAGQDLDSICITAAQQKSPQILLYLSSLYLSFSYEAFGSSFSEQEKY